MISDFKAEIQEELSIIKTQTKGQDPHTQWETLKET